MKVNTAAEDKYQYHKTPDRLLRGSSHPGGGPWATAEGGVVRTATCSHFLIPPSLALSCFSSLAAAAAGLFATSLTPTLRMWTFSHLLWAETLKETPDQEGLSWARLFLSVRSSVSVVDTLLNAFLG